MSKVKQLLQLKQSGISNRQIVREDYKRMHPVGYERSQFFYHLAQNLKTQKAPTSVLHHEPGLELYVDFAGDTRAKFILLTFLGFYALG